MHFYIFLMQGIVVTRYMTFQKIEAPESCE